jgi:N-acetyl-anhydromuramyl-L-alanine amidase AmpD
MTISIYTNAKIHRFMPDGAKGWHAGNYNGKSIGVEISAKNNDYVSDAQAKAAIRLIHYLGFKKSQVVGHGEISDKKERTEGKKVVDIIRSL